MAAEIIPIDRSDKELAKEEYTEAIRLWCRSRDTADILSREEIGAMGWRERMDAQRKAIILGLVHYYRKHERADVAPGVAVILTLLSDNDKGAATISQPTLAKLFGRSRSAIADAQMRLREDGIIITSRGRYAASYPAIPRAVTRSYNHLAWLIEAACPSDEPVKLPAGPYDCQSSGQTLRLEQRPDQSSGQPGGLKSVNRPVEAPSIVRPDPTLFHTKNSEEKRGEVPRQGAIAKVAGAMAATIAAAVLPAAAQPASPPSHIQCEPAECWQSPKTRMDASLNPHERRAQFQVWVTPTGLVEVTGEFRDELTREYPLVDLKCGLAAAGANVNPDHGAINAMRTIRRQFGFMQQDASNKAKANVARGHDAKPRHQQHYDAERESLSRDVERIRARGPARPLCEQIEELGDLP